MSYNVKMHEGDGIYEEVVLSEQEVRDTLIECLWNSDEPYDLDSGRDHVSKLTTDQVFDKLKEFEIEKAS